MGRMTEQAPKCMTEIFTEDSQKKETILGRQLRLLESMGIKDVVITTGYRAEGLIE